MLYPLKFKPIYKDKIWGGQKIKTNLKKDFSPLKNCGELWCLSGVKENVSIVENGFLSGNSLNEVLEIYMDELVGDAIYQRFGNEFPILIKFLNSKDFLSVQVHPDDKIALKKHECYGKNEMWYIIDSDSDSELIIDFKKGTDKNTYLKVMESGKITDILNFVKIAKGDVFNIPAGLVHAIGKGVLLAEIQQTSDITYRIYDWDRKDDLGNKRQLHTEDAAEAIDFDIKDNSYINYARVNNVTSPIIDTPYFTVTNLPLSEVMHLDLSTRDSFTAYVCTEGACSFIHENSVTEIEHGECVLIPADLYKLTISPKTKSIHLLEVFININSQ